MSQKTKEQELNSLGINNFSELKQEHLEKVADDFDELDKETQLEIIKQFSSIGIATTTVLKEYLKTAQHGISSNADLAKEAIKVINTDLECCHKLLAKDNLDSEDKRILLEMIKTDKTLIADIDKDHTFFLITIFKYITGILIAFLGLLALIFGRKK